MTESLATVIALAKRGASATPRDDNGFQARQEEYRRAENLRRAQPRLRDDDLRRLRWGDLESTKHLTAVIGWMDSGRCPILCLAGTVGVGKTVAACYALAEVGGVYMHAHDLVKLWHAYGAGAQAAITDACMARMLVLDDLGTEPDAERMRPALLDVIDRRQGHGRRMVITTNTNRAGLRERYPDERLWSRLVRDWAYVSAAGKDLRNDQ